MSEPGETQPEAPATAPARPRPRRQLRTNQEARDRRRRLIRYGLWAGAVILVINAVVGENGYLATLRARHELDSVAAEVARLRTENQQLKDQARRLKSDPEALEDAARRQLGLIRPGETLVIIRDAKPAAQ